MAFRSNMNTEELVQWLKGCGVHPDDCEKLEDEKFTGESFLLLSREDFKELKFSFSGALLVSKLLEQVCTRVEQNPVQPVIVQAKSDPVSHTQPIQVDPPQAGEVLVGDDVQKDSAEEQSNPAGEVLVGDDVQNDSAEEQSNPAGEVRVGDDVQKDSAEEQSNPAGEVLVGDDVQKDSAEEQSNPSLPVCAEVKDSSGKEPPNVQGADLVGKSDNYAGIVFNTLNVNKHLRHVRNALLGAAYQWNNIGMALDIPQGTLLSIHGEDNGCLIEVLKEWMHRGNATMEQLFDALKDEGVQRQDIVDTILSFEGEQRTRVGLGLV